MQLFKNQVNKKQKKLKFMQIFNKIWRKQP